MGFPFIEGLELADGVGIAPTQPAGSLGFRDRGITSLPTIRANWLPGLDSHQDKRLNRPPCYFDTTWQGHCRQDSHLHLSA